MSIENAVASTDLKHLTRQFYSAKALIISQQELIVELENELTNLKMVMYEFNSRQLGALVEPVKPIKTEVNYEQIFKHT